MSEEDLRLVLMKYQQKLFECMNQNIVLETQVEKLTIEIEKLRSAIGAGEEFE
jgi:hypothetical protein